MMAQSPDQDESTPRVGIVVLNYHHPEETLTCVRSLLAREPASTRVLWVENDADATWAAASAVLEASGLAFQVLAPDAPALPPSGTVAVMRSPTNLGFAGGNNLGLRLLHRLGVPYAWVLNNDTLLAEGSSGDLVRAAQDRPEVGLWGTTILAEHPKPTPHTQAYMGGRLQLRDFAIAFVSDPAELERDPLTFVSGCSLFSATATLADLGFIPEDYFLYYEDPALTLEARRKGLLASGVPGVVVHHLESLSTGRRSPLMEFYNRRNRWWLIQRYFPEHLNRQRRGIWYRLQKWLFRGQLNAIRIELQAYADFKAGKTGPTDRVFSRRSLHESP